MRPAKRNHAYLQAIYEGKITAIKNSVLWTGGERFNRHDAGRVMKVSAEQARHALDRMAADGHLERIEEMRSGRGFVVWRRRQESQVTKAWVKAWVHRELNYQPRWY